MTVTINGTTGIVAPAFDGAVDAADLTGTVPSSAVPYVSGRNRIINGAMTIDQRNAGASVAVTTAGQYTLDRWAVASPSSFGGQLTAQRSATAPTGFTNSLSLTATTADASIGATEYYAALQRIEGHNVADFGWGASGASTVTLSFWVRASIAGTYSGSFRNGASDRSYVFEYSVLSANTWEYKIVVITGDTTGTWVKDSGVGIDLWWSVGTGSTYQSATVGAWQDGVYLASTNQTQLIGTLNATWQITGVQLEAGSIATPFERRLYGQELALCTRYFERINYPAPESRPVTVGQWYTTDGCHSELRFEEKRAVPTCSASSASHFGVYVGTTLTAASALNLVQATVKTVNFNPNVATGIGTVNAATLISKIAAFDAYVDISAEL